MWASSILYATSDLAERDVTRYARIRIVFLESRKKVLCCFLPLWFFKAILDVNKTDFIRGLDVHTLRKVYSEAIFCSSKQASIQGRDFS